MIVFQFSKNMKCTVSIILPRRIEPAMVVLRTCYAYVCIIIRVIESGEKAMSDGIDLSITFVRSIHLRTFILYSVATDKYLIGDLVPCATKKKNKKTTQDTHNYKLMSHRMGHLLLLIVIVESVGFGLVACGCAWRSLPGSGISSVSVCIYLCKNFLSGFNLSS